MSDQKKARKSRTSSTRNSEEGANRLFEEDSLNAYNWRARFTANVRSSNSKQSLQKHAERGNLIGTFAAPPSADSEK